MRFSFSLSQLPLTFGVFLLSASAMGIITFVVKNFENLKLQKFD